MLLCLGAGNLVRPATVVRNRTTIDSELLGFLTWGAAQLGIGQGVCDAVEESLIPLEHVDDVVLLIAVYVDGAGDDHTAVREANRRATRSQTRCSPATRPCKGDPGPARDGDEPLLPGRVNRNGRQVHAPWAGGASPPGATRFPRYQDVIQPLETAPSC